MITSKLSHNYGSIKKSILSHNRWNYEYGRSFIMKKICPIAKNIDSGQPARTAQSDLSRYFFCNCVKPPLWFRLKQEKNRLIGYMKALNV